MWCINLHHRCVARYAVSIKSFALLLHRGAQNFSDNVAVPVFRSMIFASLEAARRPALPYFVTGQRASVTEQRPVVSVMPYPTKLGDYSKRSPS